MTFNDISTFKIVHSPQKCFMKFASAVRLFEDYQVEWYPTEAFRDLNVPTRDPGALTTPPSIPHT